MKNVWFIIYNTKWSLPIEPTGEVRYLDVTVDVDNLKQPATAYLSLEDAKFALEEIKYRWESDNDACVPWEDIADAYAIVKLSIVKSVKRSIVP